MLTAHQRIYLQRADLRVESEAPGTFVVILDHPAPAIATQFGDCGGSAPCDDIDPITLPFVAFRASRVRTISGTLANDDVEVRVAWYVIVLSTEPDDQGVHHIPQLDSRGEEALAFLRAFAAGLGSTPALC